MERRGFIATCLTAAAGLLAKRRHAAASKAPLSSALAAAEKRRDERKLFFQQQCALRGHDFYDMTKALATATPDCSVFTFCKRCYYNVCTTVSASGPSTVESTEQDFLFAQSEVQRLCAEGGHFYGDKSAICQVHGFDDERPYYALRCDRCSTKISGPHRR